MSAIFSCPNCRYQYSKFQDNMTLDIHYNFIIDCNDWTVGIHHKCKHTCWIYFLFFVVELKLNVSYKFQIYQSQAKDNKVPKF